MMSELLAFLESRVSKAQEKIDSIDKKITEAQGRIASDEQIIAECEDERIEAQEVLDVENQALQAYRRDLDKKEEEKEAQKIASKALVESFEGEDKARLLAFLKDTFEIDFSSSAEKEQDEEYEGAIAFSSA